MYFKLFGQSIVLPCSDKNEAKNHRGQVSLPPIYCLVFHYFLSVPGTVSNPSLGSLSNDDGDGN